MRTPLEITGLTKTFSTPAGDYVAVENVNAHIDAGEFVCIVGHSGCGKSTVLSIIAGLQDATLGGVCIDGKEVRGPGPERGMVFQSPSLLPWMSALENVALAASRREGKFTRADHRNTARQYMELAGVGEVSDQSPAELSQGTQQRVSLARAFAMEPRFLLLDEPFGMLDSLTRFELQDALLGLWARTSKTVIMVTHDVDEALYLSDRILLMSDGPRARIADTMEIRQARPRNRAEWMRQPEYFAKRAKIIEFLEKHAHRCVS